MNPNGNPRRTHGVALLLSASLLGFATHAPGQQFGGQSFGGTSTRRSGSTTYPSSTEVGTASFSTDPETRKLVVVTDDETAKYISQVVSNLDRPAPQVLIKVVFLEVTHRRGSDIGVEGAYTRNLEGGTVGSVLQNFGGLPGITSGNGLFTAAGSEFQATLRAIAEAGKLEVLSRPTILARNNQQAYINVGQRVPLITGTRYDAFGNQINSFTYQDVGIILQVTPFITSDGFVEMVVAPEISNLSDETVAVSTITNNTTAGQPIINRRYADTVVVTPDGQTVVIGGLMQNAKTESVAKIPLLGDIPLLGAAFRRKVVNDEKTELLIFLTPYIVKHPSELAALSHTESGNTRLAPKVFPKEDLDRFFDTLPANQDSTDPRKKKEPK